MGKHLNRRPLGEHRSGYCRPPKRKKGDSRKPSPPAARSIGTRQMMADFFEALEETIEVTQGGKKLSLPAGKIVFRQLVARAAKGESWAIRRLTELQLKLLDAYEAGLEISVRTLQSLEMMERTSPESMDEEAKSLQRELRRRIRNPGRELLEPDEEEPERREPEKPRRYGPL